MGFHLVMTFSGYLMSRKLFQSQYLANGAPHSENICSFIGNRDL